MGLFSSAGDFTRTAVCQGCHAVKRTIDLARNGIIRCLMPRSSGRREYQYRYQKASERRTGIRIPWACQGTRRRRQPWEPFDRITPKGTLTTRHAFQHRSLTRESPHRCFRLENQVFVTHGPAPDSSPVCLLTKDAGTLTRSTGRPEEKRYFRKRLQSGRNNKCSPATRILNRHSSPIVSDMGINRDPEKCLKGGPGTEKGLRFEDWKHAFRGPCSGKDHHAPESRDDHGLSRAGSRWPSPYAIV
jgi:hypothetical protein